MGDINREQLVKQLIEADLQTLEQYKDSVYSEEENNFYDSLLWQFGAAMGYSCDTAKVIVDTSFWYYSWLVNEKVYKLIGIHAEYYNALNSIISERCDKCRFSREDVVEVASIFYWQHMKALNTTSNIQFPLLPELIDINKILTREVESSSQLLERSFLNDWLPDMQVDYADYIKETLFWNLLRIYGLGSVFPQKSADLVLEALEVFMDTTFHLKYNAIAYPLSLAIKYQKMDDIDYIKLLDCSKKSDIEDVAELCGCISDENARKAWCEWRNLVNPSEEVHCLVYALAFLGKPQCDYYSKFVSKESQEFLLDVNKLITLCKKTAPAILSEYVGQRYQMPYKLEQTNDGLHVSNNDAPARSIKTMVQELDIPITDIKSKDAIQADDSLILEETSTQVTVSKNNNRPKHLPFPEKFNKISPDKRKDALTELYKFVGNKFITKGGDQISVDGFTVLFGYHESFPKTPLELPYFWDGPRSEFQYLTLSLYPSGIWDESLLNELIKDPNKPNINWSTNRSSARKALDKQVNKHAKNYRKTIDDIADKYK